MNSKEIELLIEKNEKSLEKQFAYLNGISLYNQEKVLNAFRNNKIALRHFNGTTGYGSEDVGRDTLKKVYAEVFGAEACLVSPFIVSGTHAISLALFSVLKHGERVLSVTGRPYDTLLKVIDGGDMSLKADDITFDYIPLDGSDFDYKKIEKALKENKYSMVYLQRSRGYDEREAISVDKMQPLTEFVRSCGFDGCIFCDNCYGEFVEKKEPTDVGVDLVAGSLIKNIGGGITPTGGYIAGKQKYIDRAEARLTSPSIAGEVGSYAFGYQYFYEGLFLAPHVVNQALKGSMLIGAVMGKLGYHTVPAPFNLPYDITRSVMMGNERDLLKFIQSVQYVSPVDSFVEVAPWNMPGYEDKVVMAAGCFVDGASIELSCDAPLREPYNAFIQGGLTYEHVVIALKEILSRL